MAEHAAYLATGWTNDQSAYIELRCRCQGAGSEPIFEVSAEYDVEADLTDVEAAFAAHVGLDV